MLVLTIPCPDEAETYQEQPAFVRNTLNLMHKVNDTEYAGFKPGCFRVTGVVFRWDGDGTPCVDHVENLHVLMLIDVDVSGYADMERIYNKPPGVVVTHGRASFDWLPDPISCDLIDR